MHCSSGAGAALAQAGASPPPRPLPRRPLLPRRADRSASPSYEPVEERVDIAGWSDGFYLRDPHDHVRFYPHLLAEADFYSSFGPGVTSVSAPDVAAGLKPRLSIRRARVGFDAELFRRWSVTALIEFGGQALSDTNGTLETSAAAPGSAPTATTGRYAPVQAVASAPIPADVYIGYSVCKCFNIQIGQFNAPFSLDNRTGDDYYPMLERPVAIRNFVMPSPRDIGGLIWGELGPKVFNYELGVFGGDGQNRPSVDARVDFMGRDLHAPLRGGRHQRPREVHADRRQRPPRRSRLRPRSPTTCPPSPPARGSRSGSPRTPTASAAWCTSSPPARRTGSAASSASGRAGSRSRARPTTSSTTRARPSTATSSPTPSASAACWASGGTRSSPPGPGATRSSRPSPASTGPATSTSPSAARGARTSGVEVIALVSGINGSYQGATRLLSTPDANTPMGDLTVYQLSLGANYWHTKHARFGVYYSAYLTPGSGTSTNEALVAANLVKQANGSAGAGQVMHELSARVAVTF